MKIIVVSKNNTTTRTLSLGQWGHIALSICLLGLPLLGIFSSFIVYAISQASNHTTTIVTPQVVSNWNESLAEQASQLKDINKQSEQKISALTIRLAELQARLVRLDALGERLVKMAHLDQGEFDFSDASPAVGGPELLGNQEDAAPSIDAILGRLGDRIEDRQEQLGLMESLLSNKKLQSEVFLAGRPITKGWMSSRFGKRPDPFTGKIAMHEGVDFAGKEGSDIISVAAGVVTWSGDRYGYGNLIEVNHGNGYSTRYGHCKELLVKAGDVVKKGQLVALMGSSGRSTGPHVHFEVYKNGRVVDPATYIHRAHR